MDISSLPPVIETLIQGLHSEYPSTRIDTTEIIRKAIVYHPQLFVALIQVAEFDSNKIARQAAADTLRILRTRSAGRLMSQNAMTDPHQQYLFTLTVPLVHEGKTINEIINILEQKGIPSYEAPGIVDTVLKLIDLNAQLPAPNSSLKLPKVKPNPQARAIARQKAMGRMLIGIFALIVGSALTLTSYESAKPGGTVIIWYGAIFFGFVLFISGLIGWLAPDD